MSEATVARQTRFVDAGRVQSRLRAADFVVLLVATMAVFLASSLWIPAHAVSMVGIFALEVALGSVLTLSWLGLYGLDALLDPRRAIGGALVVTFGLAAVVFLTTHLWLFALEPWWLWAWAILCALHVTATRMAACAWAARKAAAGAFRQRVAVLGWGEQAEAAVRLLEANDPVRIEVVGVFDDRRGKAGAMADLVGAAERGLIDLVIIAIPFSTEDRLLQTLTQLWPLPVDVRISGQASQLKLSPRAYGYLGKLPLLSVFDRPLNCRRHVKDIFDRVLACVFLVLLLPLLVLIAAAIRLESRGPALSVEQRFGFDGKPIAVYRFRCTTGGRQTGVGAVLRKLRLDGLPQLLNVVKGELSLVGPRPHPPEADSGGNLYQEVIDGYFARHKVKPGLTGWAQINGWPATEKTAKQDLEYVDRWSLLFDLYILLKAPFAPLRKSAPG